MAAIINDGNRGVSVLRYAQVRHMKEIKRRGTLSQAAGNFPVGSNVRIRKV